MLSGNTPSPLSLANIFSKLMNGPKDVKCFCSDVQNLSETVPVTSCRFSIFFELKKMFFLWCTFCQNTNNLDVVYFSSKRQWRSDMTPHNAERARSSRFRKIGIVPSCSLNIPSPMSRTIAQVCGRAVSDALQPSSETIVTFYGWPDVLLSSWLENHHQEL